MDNNVSKNQVAPAGAIFVCVACGKRSRDLYGYQKISRSWDASCVLNSMLCVESSVVMMGDMVVSADPWDEETETTPDADFCGGSDNDFCLLS